MADLGGRHAALPISPLIQSLCFQGLYVVKGEQKSYLLSPFFDREGRLSRLYFGE